MSLTTSRFKMSLGHILYVLFSFNASKWLYLIIAGLIGLISAVIIWGEIEWIICCLMVILIVLPMAFVFLFINYGMHPDIAFNVVPHKLSLTEKGISIEMYKLKKKEHAHEDKDPRSEDLLKENEEEDEEIVKREIPFLNLSGKYKLGPDCVYLLMRKTGFVYIPSSAFGSPEEMNDFLNNIYSK